MTPAVFPVTGTVYVEPFLADGTDAHNDVVPSYGPSRAEPVYGWDASDDSEDLDGRNQTRVPLDLYAPVEFSAEPRDRITIPGLGRFEVVGHPARWRNPFGWEPGRRIRCLKLEG